ncbi:MAG: dTDP-4-dehydrorhamnose 3,5-epimerase [Magnetovibrio sp.]|nr:dTDP-4-dehydrorhamnose 3,5-epimerase [Magnetovibrio sp.]
MNLKSLDLPEVKLLTPKRYFDDRGWFSETYNSKTFSKLGLRYTFVQDNQSLTNNIGTIRGLHFQNPPYAQVKLLRVLQGRIFDAVVDIRVGSPRFGKFVAIELSAEDGSAILVPEGFAHGFMSLEEKTEVLYKVSKFHVPSAEFGINPMDPDLKIPWPVEDIGHHGNVYSSERDSTFPMLKEAHSAFIYPERIKEK